MVSYPDWFYYPSHSRPPDWVYGLTTIVAEARTRIDSGAVDGLTSDSVLRELRFGLEQSGWRVETGKKAAEKIHLPVLFGESGRERVSFEVDAVHAGLGIALEVEAGRGARGNAVYRDLVRASLLVDVRFLALGVMRSYRHRSLGTDLSVPSYRDARALLDAIYGSGRLKLPFEGVLLFGY